MKLSKKYIVEIDEIIGDDLIEYEPSQMDSSEKSIKDLDNIAGGDYWQRIIYELKGETIDGFHVRHTVQNIEYELDRTNFAKRCCADDANLCEVIDINASGASEDGGNDAQNIFVSNILANNRFNTMFRKQLELCSGLGTVGAYIRLVNYDLMSNGEIRGGNITVEYVNASGIVPLTVVNDEVIECAFIGTDILKGKEVNTLVVFELENELYKVTSVTYDKQYKAIEADLDRELGNVKPFAILKNAEVCDIENMEGFGFPKIWNATPYFKTIDLIFGVLSGDLDKADKLLLVNEALVEFGPDGKPIPPNKQKRKIFTILGSKFAGDDSYVKEYNPEIRIQQVTDTIELALSLLSMMFGYGTKKYTFEQGQIKTATEYIGEKQDSMQELNKQRYQVTQYITDLVRAIIWYSNKYNKTTYDEDVELSIDYNDSYITDKYTQLIEMRNDISIIGAPMLTIRYLQEKYNLTKDEAKAWYEGSFEEDDETNPLGGGIADKGATEVKEATEDVAGKTLNGAQTTSLINVIQQYQSGTLTHAQAVNIISVSIGITKEEARELMGEVV